MRVEVQIRAGREGDLPRLVDIYNHYVRHGHVVFDTELATVESRREWFAEFTGARHQILVADGKDGVLGCATSRRYRNHPSFDGTVETGIYLDPAARGQGIGRRLYETLLGALEHHGVHMAVAGVALPNEASVALHRSLGFREVGVFHDYALKHDVQISSVWFQRPIPPVRLAASQIRATTSSDFARGLSI